MKCYHFMLEAAKKRCLIVNALLLVWSRLLAVWLRKKWGLNKWLTKWMGAKYEPLMDVLYSFWHLLCAPEWLHLVCFRPYLMMKILALTFVAKESREIGVSNRWNIYLWFHHFVCGWPIILKKKRCLHAIIKQIKAAQAETNDKNWPEKDHGSIILQNRKNRFPLERLIAPS